MKSLILAVLFFSLIPFFGEAQSLIQAVSSGDTSTVSQLLNNGADVNQTDSIGNTSLIIASAGGNSGMVSLILQHGADVNKTGAKGYSALIAASQNGYIDVVTILYNNGADSKYRNPNDKNMRAFDYCIEEEENWNTSSSTSAKVDYVAVFNLLSVATH